MKNQKPAQPRNKALSSQASKEWRQKNKQHIAQYRKAYRQKKRIQRQTESNFFLSIMQNMCDQLDRIERAIEIERTAQSPTKKASPARKAKSMFC